MLIFAGNDFDVTEDYRRLKSLLTGKCFNTYLQSGSGRQSKAYWWLCHFTLDI